jgi:maleylpyruvate isomerase
MRLDEVFLHHVDLDVGFTPAHWPAAYTGPSLGALVTDFGARDDVPALGLHAEDTDRSLAIHARPDAPTIHGPEAALLAWLAGRSNGDGLTVEPHGPLPTIPAWG